jgi:hypothetical protein
MWHRLLCQEQAALEWEWVEGMCFCDNEEEDFMQELVLYAWRRNNTNKQKRGWTVTPLYREKFEWCDFEWISFKRDEFEPGGTTWSFERANGHTPFHDLTVLECQRLQMVCVCFDAGRMGNVLRIIVYYMTCCNTLEAHYYVNIGFWFTRCGSIQECVNLFDIIAANIDRVLHDKDRYSTCMYVINHLTGKMQRECDSVRLAYMHRKVALMKQELETLQIIAL